MSKEGDYQLYLRRAAEVETIAASIGNQSDKEAMLKICADWRTLAERAAKRAGVVLHGQQ